MLCHGLKACKCSFAKNSAPTSNAFKSDMRTLRPPDAKWRHRWWWNCIVLDFRNQREVARRINLFMPTLTRKMKKPARPEIFAPNLTKRKHSIMIVSSFSFNVLTYWPILSFIGLFYLSCSVIWSRFHDETERWIRVFAFSGKNAFFFFPLFAFLLL